MLFALHRPVLAKLSRDDHHPLFESSFYRRTYDITLKMNHNLSKTTAYKFKIKPAVTMDKKLKLLERLFS